MKDGKKIIEQEFFSIVGKLQSIIEPLNVEKDRMAMSNNKTRKGS